MHNTPLENARFKRQFTITNLRYMLGDPVPDLAKIEQAKKWIAEAEAEIAALEAKEATP